MSDSSTRHTSEALILRNQSGRLILPATIAGRIHNFRETSEGTLVSVNGPAPLLGRRKSTGNVHGWDFSIYEYGTMRGVFHTTLLNGSREVLLIHSGEKILSLQGWNAIADPANAWETLIGDGATSSDLVYDLSAYDFPSFPTQFEATPTGVVIVPQGFRAVFYDGIKALPLGYDRPPGAPLGFGPVSRQAATSPNDSGYIIEYQVVGDPGSKNLRLSDFKNGRLGTTARALNPVSGSNTSLATLLPGEYQCAAQFIDAFGNLSPISDRSATISFDEQPVGTSSTPPSRIQKAVMWGDIDRGRTGTIGRILHRTRDLQNAGTEQLFTLTANAGAGVFGAFATVPDNRSQYFPDNTPDAWLVTNPTEAIAVPLFRLCRLAFGRLWIANTTGDPGILIPSLPGRYGTFEVNSELFPDPGGGAITGLWNAPEGLLVFTGSATFLLTMSIEGSVGDNFSLSTLNPSVGCIAPSSLANRANGDVIWLGINGFYSYSKGEIIRISDDIQPTLDRLNKVRAVQATAAYDNRSKEYRCWLPIDASSENNLCLIWDGEGWRERTREKLRDVCVTRDRHGYMIGVGDVTAYGLTGDVLPVVETNPLSQNVYTGVWVLDHETFTFQPVETDSLNSAVTRKNIIETCWIEWGSSLHRKTTKTIYLALRESVDASATIKVYRDWRQSASIYTDTSNATLISPEDKPPLWGTQKWDSEEYWTKRRPYWKRVDIEVPSCEVYKIVIETDKKLEFIGMTIDIEPKLGGFGSRVP